MERKLHGPGLKTDLLGWITEKRNNGLAILPSLVRLKALKNGQRRKVRDSSQALQGRKPLVPAFYLVEWPLASTEDNPRSATSRSLRREDHQIPSFCDHHSSHLWTGSKLLVHHRPSQKFLQMTFFIPWQQNTRHVKRKSM